MIKANPPEPSGILEKDIVAIMDFLRQLVVEINANLAVLEDREDDGK